MLIKAPTQVCLSIIAIPLSHVDRGIYTRGGICMATVNLYLATNLFGDQMAHFSSWYLAMEVSAKNKLNNSYSHCLSHIH